MLLFYYIYLLKTEDTELQKFKEYLLKKYHANDEKIFNSRFEKKFKHNLLMNTKEILEDMLKLNTLKEKYKAL